METMARGVLLSRISDMPPSQHLICTSITSFLKNLFQAFLHYMRGCLSKPWGVGLGMRILELKKKRLHRNKFNNINNWVPRLRLRACISYGLGMWM